MRHGAAHLAYCTNIHAGESWAEVRANLERFVLGVKARVCPDAPFGVGLRLSARAAHELAAPAALAELRDFLDRHALYVFTINGFPYGAFHGTRVKQAVYLPDWLDDARVAYTCLLARLLGELVPDGVRGTISTVPGCFRARGGDAAKIADNLRRCGDALARAGCTLALEPEPACLLETTDEAIAFVHDHRLAGHRIGLCLDACHAAVEFEALPAGAHELVHKIQLSCGLRVAPVDAAARAGLAAFADDTYLHQVVARRRDGSLARYVDLPDALADPAPADEWRIHFHVPIFREQLGAFRSTQPFLAGLLAGLDRSTSTHLEVETYTWDVLPAEFRQGPVEDAIARELRWVSERLA
ncbi:MAG TPA: metabolite traffic protein EboE [Kofleriaceae bacterium]|nr:metabolite traffic protein EboE [Kofleriaceae bacterium]